MKLDYDVYYKKVYGGWLGKSIAGNMGGPLECCRKIMDFSDPEQFSPTEMMANDDLDVQLIWLNVLLEKGLDFTSDDLMEAFIAHYQIYPNEYGYGKRNYMRGIRPPHSGVYANEFFAESMGCPIRAEIWAMIMPGNPEEACRMARLDGSLDHGEESIYAEQFIAALETMAFFENSIKTTIEKAILYIPENSKVAKVIREAIAFWKQGWMWKESAEQLWLEYGNQDSSTMFYNLGLEIIALLYGEGDFNRTVTLAVNGGYDTDCTAATVGAILGIFYGADVIESRWKEQVGENIVTGCNDLKYAVGTITDLAETVCRIGVHCSRIGRNPVIIEGGVPLPVLSSDRELNLQISYINGMDIAPGEIREVALNMESKKGGCYEIMLALPEDLEGFCLPEKVKMAAGEKKEIHAYVCMKEDITQIREINSCKFVIVGEGKSYKEQFGLVGAILWKIAGPFVDLYNFKDISKEERIRNREYYKIPGAQILRYMSLAEAHNNFADIDKPYIEEDFQPEYFKRYYQSGKAYLEREDKICIDNMFGFQGVCCIYGFTRIWAEAEEEVQMHIGSTTPYKLWMNGELVKEQKESNGYSPYTDMVQVNLKKGENQFVVKLIRYDAGQKFTYVFRQKSFGLRGMIKTGLNCITEKEALIK